LASEDERYLSSQPSHEHPVVTHDHGAESKAIGAIDGALVADGDIFKWRKAGKKQWERTLRDEAQRVEILRQFFGIDSTEEERKAMKGTAADISVQRSTVSRGIEFQVSN
jgi:hypothetical protein